MSKIEIQKNKIGLTYIFQKFGIYILLIVAVIISAALSDYFFTDVNLFNVLKQISVVGIISFGECMLIIAGQIDLSCGAVIAAGGCTAVIIANVTGSVFLGMFGGIAFGAAAGLVNGYFVTRYRLPSFLITLGMQIFMRGFALLITNAKAISPDSSDFKILGQSDMFGIIPYLVVLVFGLCLIFWFLMNRTSFGRYLYAIGGNEESAKASGVNINKIKLIAFTLAGLLSGIAGIAIASRLNVGQPNIGTQGVAFEFDAIIGVVLGGASLMGGVGSVVAALFGCIFVGVLNNVLNLLNVSAYLQQMVKGTLIVIAVVIDAKGKGYGGRQIFRPLIKKLFGAAGSKESKIKNVEDIKND